MPIPTLPFLTSFNALVSGGISVKIQCTQILPATLLASGSSIIKARDFVSKTEGTLLCPEGAATLAAFQKSLSEGLISNDDRVVLFNCASGLKYSLPETKSKLNKDQPVDYSIF